MLQVSHPIKTARLLLRAFTQNDFEVLRSIQSRADVTRYLYWEARSEDQVRDALDLRLHSSTLSAEGDNLILAVEQRDSGTVVGDVHLRWTSAEHRSGELGFVLHPDYHGQGFATEAAQEMLRLGFEAVGLHRIVGRCDGRNHASARVMEKLGMRREAHFRQNEFVKGEWCDEMVYAMLAEEWQAGSNGPSRSIEFNQ